MHELKSQNQKKMTGIFADETFVAIGKPDIKLMQRMEKKGAHKGEELVGFIIVDVTCCVVLVLYGVPLNVR